MEHCSTMLWPATTVTFTRGTSKLGSCNIPVYASILHAYIVLMKTKRSFTPDDVRWVAAPYAVPFGDARHRTSTHSHRMRYIKRWSCTTLRYALHCGAVWHRIRCKWVLPQTKSTITTLVRKYAYLLLLLNDSNIGWKAQCRCQLCVTVTTISPKVGFTYPD